MTDYKEAWKPRVAAALGVDVSQVIAELPPKSEMGDIGFPMFGFAKVLRKAPAQIAAALASTLGTVPSDPAAGFIGGTAAAEGPYVNVRLDRGAFAAALLRELAEKGPDRPGTLAGSRYMVEFSSPNTNKPLHLGHLRNDVLGESVSRILAAAGAEVRKGCIINDRGIHICKSMLAYQRFGGGKTPESEGVKSDKFVGDFYVKFHQMEVEAEEAAKKGAWPAGKPTPGDEARELLRKWEAGDAETVALWKQMNGWAVDGMKKTYERTGVSFDQYYFESNTYLLGKDMVFKGLEQGIFYKQDDGAIAVDLSDENLDKKILLRADGTSIYITQDIGLAIYRHNDWPFNRLVYVVGNEQQYHFRVLFSILRRLGYDWAQNLHHLSYGMVNLPEGKMKSREGTVVDADDLIDSLAADALAEIREKEREEAVGDPAAAAEKVALGALHYFLLQVSAARDMMFNPRESLSFTGNTGPYLQYMGARISALLKKANLTTSGASWRSAITDHTNLEGAEKLAEDPEWELVKCLSGYGDAIAAAAEGLDPSLLTGYLYELSKAFSRFYHDCPILQAEDPAVREGRLALSRAVLLVLKDALRLVCIPFLESM